MYWSAVNVAGSVFVIYTIKTKTEKTTTKIIWKFFALIATETCIVGNLVLTSLKTTGSIEVGVIPLQAS